MRKKRVLVTGGAGFLGSHICERLLKEGNEVLCLDNFFSGCKANIAHLLPNPYFELMRHNVCQPFYLECDEVYHLACPASPCFYQFDPVQTTKTSVEGMINSLGLAKRTKATLFQASTSEIYGDPLEHPQKEEYRGNVNPHGIRACYDEGKRCAETLCFDYVRQYGVKVKVGRIFNTYGPRMLLNDGRVVTNFIVQALQGEDLTIFGDGSQTRSLCYVDDLIEGILRFMKTPPECIGPINLGNPREVTILQLAELIIRLTNSGSKLRFCPLPQDDPIKRQPDITLARKVLKWEPQVSLEDGLKLTVLNIQEQLVNAKGPRALDGAHYMRRFHEEHKGS